MTKEQGLAELAAGYHRSVSPEAFLAVFGEESTPQKVQRADCGSIRLGWDPNPNSGRVKVMGFQVPSHLWGAGDLNVY